LQGRVAVQGHPARFAVELDSLPDEEGGYVLYDCRCPASESRTVSLLPREEAT
jgi:hypothetical protein